MQHFLYMCEYDIPLNKNTVSRDKIPFAAISKPHWTRRAADLFWNGSRI